MLFFTLNELVSKARHPDMLRIAVVDQGIEDQRDKIAALPYAKQIRYVFIHDADTLGVSWARSLAMTLYDEEEWFMQIDSHMYFEKHWDSSLRSQIAALLPLSVKPILTTYPYGFEMVDGKAECPIVTSAQVLILRPKDDDVLTPTSVTLHFHAKHMTMDEPAVGCHIAGGFIFCSGSLVEEVPYDPYLYFHGEEQSMAVRAFTRGWDIFHPKVIPMYHLYKKNDTPYDSHHWNKAEEKGRVFSIAYLQGRAKDRLCRLVRGELYGMYGLGNARTMEQFKLISGIDYVANTIENPWGEFK